MTLILLLLIIMMCYFSIELKIFIQFSEIFAVIRNV